MRYFSLLFWLLMLVVVSIPTIFIFSMASFFDGVNKFLDKRLSKLWGDL